MGALMEGPTGVCTRVLMGRGMRANLRLWIHDTCIDELRLQPKLAVEVALNSRLCHFGCALFILRALHALLDFDAMGAAPGIEALKECLRKPWLSALHHGHLLIIEPDAAAAPLLAKTFFDFR